MDFILNDLPSMNNIYDSTYYPKTREYEMGLANDKYKKARNPFKSGVVPRPAESSMFYDTTDNPYNQNKNRNYVESLSGDAIPINDFKHGNMQPFLKKGITQNTNLNNNQNFYEKFGYNEYKHRKTEVEGFFEPTANIIGNDNNTSFLLDRTNVTNVQNNYNPVSSVRVAPGLNMGYTSEGSGGFHQADTRNYVKPPQKDELRPKSDQRSSLFEIPIQAPMKSIVDKRGVVEPFQKHKPEKAYEQNEDNWFKGQSYLKKDSSRPNENLRDTTRRNIYHDNYYGSVRIDEGMGNTNDYGRNSILVYDTEKHEIAKQETQVANFSSVIKAMVAPITDAFKITMKEYFLNPVRDYGNAVPQMPEKSTTYDPVNHIMKTTVKETTIHDNENGNLTGNKETYSGLYDDARTTIKETTIHDNENGNLTGNKETYTSLYDDAKTTGKETILCESDKTNLQGNKETYSGLYDDARTTAKETMIHENENGNLSGNKETYSGLYDDARTTAKETMIHDEYSGNIRVRETGEMKRDDKMRVTTKQTLPTRETTRNINNVNYYSTYVYDPSIVAKTTLKETVVNGTNSSTFGFIGGLINQIIGGYNINNKNAKHTQRESSHIDYEGGINSQTSFTQMNREAAYNAEIDGTREMLLINAGYTPNGSGEYKGLDKDDIQMDVKKQTDIQEGKEPIRNPNKVYQLTPLSIDEETLTKDVFKENAYENRLDSAILSSLLENKDAIKINPIQISN
jgi:hypothetical protein